MNEQKIQKDIEEIKKSVKKIEKFLFYRVLWNWVKIGVIALIVLLSYLYLPQFLVKLKQSITQMLPPIQQQGVQQFFK